MNAGRIYRSLSPLRAGSPPKHDATERCELCAKALAPSHRHLAEPRERKLVCTCEACALLFPAQASLRYKAVPRDVRRLDALVLSDAQWDALAIPIGMAFFLRSSVSERTVAFYPGPAGATESLLELEAWQEIVGQNPSLASMEPDVEALVINRLWTPHQQYIFPIDRCYHLVGLMRTKWRGFMGGTELWQELRTFFDDCR